MLRLRALSRDWKCPVCKEELEEVLLTNNASEALDDVELEDLSFDASLGVRFIDERIRWEAGRLFEYRCLVDDCENCAESCFQSLGDLEGHLWYKHWQQFCKTCLHGRPAFLCEQHVYDSRDIDRHCRDGDVARLTGRRPTPPVPPHALCEFCQERIYNEDELLRHMYSKHHLCHICERMGWRNDFYANWKCLALHYQESHHVCPHRECKRGGFRLIAFAESEELDLHVAVEHPDVPSSASYDRKGGKLCMKLQVGHTPFAQQQERAQDRGKGQGRGQNASTPADSTDVHFKWPPGVTAADLHEAGSAEEQTAWDEEAAAEEEKEESVVFDRYPNREILVNPGFQVSTEHSDDRNTEDKKAEDGGEEEAEGQSEEDDEADESPEDNAEGTHEFVMDYIENAMKALKQKIDDYRADENLSPSDWACTVVDKDDKEVAPGENVASERFPLHAVFTKQVVEDEVGTNGARQLKPELEKIPLEATIAKDGPRCGSRSCLSALSVVLTVLCKSKGSANGVGDLSGEAPLRAAVELLTGTEVEGLLRMGKHLDECSEFSSKCDWAPLDRVLGLWPQFFLLLEAKGSAGGRQRGAIGPKHGAAAVAAAEAESNWRTWKLSAQEAVLSLGVREQRRLQIYVELCVQHRARLAVIGEHERKQELFPSLGGPAIAKVEPADPASPTDASKTWASFHEASQPQAQPQRDQFPTLGGGAVSSAPASGNTGLTLLDGPSSGWSRQQNQEIRPGDSGGAEAFPTLGSAGGGGGGTTTVAATGKWASGSSGAALLSAKAGYEADRPQAQCDRGEAVRAAPAVPPGAESFPTLGGSAATAKAEVAWGAPATGAPTWGAASGTAGASGTSRAPVAKTITMEQWMSSTADAKAAEPVEFRGTTESAFPSLGPAAPAAAQEAVPASWGRQTADLGSFADEPFWRPKPEKKPKDAKKSKAKAVADVQANDDVASKAKAATPPKEKAKDKEVVASKAKAASKPTQPKSDQQKACEEAAKAQEAVAKLKFSEVAKPKAPVPKAAAPKVPEPKAEGPAAPKEKAPTVPMADAFPSLPGAGRSKAKEAAAAAEDAAAAAAAIADEGAAAAGAEAALKKKKGREKKVLLAFG